MSKRGQKFNKKAPVADADLEQLYHELMLRGPMPDMDSLQPLRRESLWTSIIPKIVPSVAMYGAYEEPL